MGWNEISRNLGAAALAAMAAAAGPAPAAAQSSWRDGWHFAVTPYVWMAALKGDLATLSNLPEVEVDASFSDILDHTDFTVMLALEARYHRAGLLADVVYLDLSADESTPGPLFSGVDLETTTLFSTIGAFYRVLERDAISADVIAGMRVWSVDTELKFAPGLLAGRRERDDESWVDPLIAARGSAALGHGLSISAFADVGGFGAASERTWQLAGTLDWQARDWLVLRAGYRHLDVDYRNSGFEFDASMTGPVIGAALRF
jgi:hypothetical protein